MKKFSILLLLLFPLHAAFAQWSNDTLQNTVVSDSSGLDEVIPLQATAPNGYTYVCWFRQNGSNYNLMMQLFDVQGHKMWGTDGLLVSNHPTGSALYIYDFAVDHEGNAIVAFQDERNGNLMPVAYKLDQSGNFVWGADGIVLHDSTATFEVSPAIGVLGNNDVVIAWNATASSKWIAMQTITAAGALGWSDNARIKSNNKDYSRAQFANPDDNTFVLNYIEESGNFPSVTSTIYLNRYAQDGTALWANPTKISTYTTSFFEWPVVIADNNKGAFIAFNSGEPGNPATNDAFIQHVDSNGANIFGTNGTEISVFSNHHRLVSGIAYLPDSGQVGVSLKVLDNAQGQAGIYAQKIDAAGNRLWGNAGVELLPLSSTDYHEPFGLVLSDTSWMVAYTEGDVITQEFKVVKFDWNGNVVWNKTISAVSSNKYDATMSPFMNDQEVVVWYDQRNGGGVYAQNISGEGMPGVVPTAVDAAPATLALVYPTLVHDALTIVRMNQSPADLMLFNSSGVMVKSVRLLSGVQQIAVNTLPSGIYFYRLSDGNKVQTGGIVRE